MSAMVNFSPRARFVMCPPDHFTVGYAINPWMDPEEWHRDPDGHLAEAQTEWRNLKALYESLGAEVIEMASVPDLPDLVFTANAAAVAGRKALLGRYRHPERQGEEPHNARFFERLKEQGVIDHVVRPPEGMVIEGMGDALLDRKRDLFWFGYGQRSSKEAGQVLAETFNKPVVELELVTPDFYHLDTALSPLANGHILYVPRAFNKEGRNRIAEIVGDESLLIPLEEQDAVRLVANIVSIGRDIILPAASAKITAHLEDCGYRVYSCPLPSFHLGGGAVFCLTLRID